MMLSDQHSSLIDFLQQQQMAYTWIDFDQSILFLPQISLYVQWMPTTSVLAQDKSYCQTVTREYHALGLSLWRIWEDQWVLHFEMLSGRLQSLYGNFTSVYARNCKVVRIDKITAAPFLKSNHLLGYVTTRYTFGLFYKEEIVALACFSNPRKILKVDIQSRSSELVRYACKSNYLIAGGLSKLIMAFTRMVELDDIVTYADLDYTIGQGYRLAGFRAENLISPHSFRINKENNRFYINHKQKNTQHSEPSDTATFYTSGSMKWIFFPILGKK